MRSREDVVVKLLQGKTYQKKGFRLMVDKIIFEDGIFKILNELTCEKIDPTFCAYDFIEWSQQIFENAARKVYGNDKTIPHLSKVLYYDYDKYIKLTSSQILVSEDSESRVKRKLQSYFRERGVSTIIDRIKFAFYGYGTASCKIDIKKDSNNNFKEEFFNKYLPDFGSERDAKPIRSILNEIIEECETNSPIDHELDLEYLTFTYGGEEFFR